MTTAAELFALQETDLAIDGAVARLEEIETQLRETEELISARQRVEERRQSVHEAQERQKDLDFDAGEVRGKAAEIEGKLYGGGVKNPKELEDYQADLKSLRGQQRKREDTLLEVMLELEEHEAALAEAEKALAAVQAAWDADQATLRSEQAELNKELENLRAKRSTQVEGMDRAQLSLYDALRQRRQGTAVAVVERGLCQGCRISLPMSILQKARTGAGLVQCVSCERILLVN